MSMFSFFGAKKSTDDLPAAADNSANGEGGPSTGDEAAVAPAAAEADDPATSTGFSFMNSGGTDNDHEEDNDENRESSIRDSGFGGGPSGFGFMAGGGEASAAGPVDDAAVDRDSVGGGPSSFGFMQQQQQQQQPEPPAPEPVVAKPQPPPAAAVPERRPSASSGMSPAAAGGVHVKAAVPVVRKKRASSAKVGYGRQKQQQQEEEDTPEPPSPSPAPAATTPTPAPAATTPTPAQQAAMQSPVSKLQPIEEDNAPEPASAQAPAPEPAAVREPERDDEAEAEAPANAPEAEEATTRGSITNAVSYNYTNAHASDADDEGAEGRGRLGSAAGSRSRTNSASAAAATAAMTSTMSPLELLEHDVAGIVGGFVDVVRGACDAHAGKMQRRKERVVRMETLRGRIEEVQALLSTAEAGQLRYAEEEDFEKADALTSVIDGHREELQRAEEELREVMGEGGDTAAGAGDALATAASSSTLTPELIETQLSLLNTVAQRLAATKEAQEAKLAIAVTEAEKRHTRENNRLRQEEDRLQLQRDHTAREEEVLNSEVEITETTIKQQTDEEQRTKAALTEKVVEVGNEIMALERQLLEKRQEAKKLKSSLEDVEARIVSVRKKFDRQLARIADKKDSLLATQSELQLETVTLEGERAAYDRDFSEAQAQAEQSKQWTEDLGRQCAVAAKLQEALKYIAQHMVYDVRNAVASSDSGGGKSGGSEEGGSSRAALESSYASVRQEYDSLVAEHSAVQEQLRQRREEAAGIEEALPRLEGDKKAHAAARRFKEAAAASKELKTLVARKEELVGELSSLDQQEAGLAGQVAEKLEGVNAAKQLLVDLDKEADRALLNVCRKHQHVLQTRYLDAILQLEQGQSDVHAPTAAFRSQVVKLLETEIGVLSDNVAFVRQKHSLQPLVEDEIVDDEVELVADAEPAAEPEADIAAEATPEAEAEVSKAADESEASVASVAAEGADAAEGDAEPASSEETADEAAAGAEEGGTGGEDAPEEAQRRQQRSNDVARARILAGEIASLSEKVEEAMGVEDYERASDLDDALQAKTAEQQALLTKLNCASVEDLE